jgi:hypothetical protein
VTEPWLPPKVCTTPCAAAGTFPVPGKICQLLCPLTSSVVPSLKVAIARKVWVNPKGTTTLAGVTSSDDKTLEVTAPVCPPGTMNESSTMEHEESNSPKRGMSFDRWDFATNLSYVLLAVVCAL